MNEMVSHIEFLLHEHNCVIIPDFGGFVVNTQPSRRDGVSSFYRQLANWSSIVISHITMDSWLSPS